MKYDHRYLLALPILVTTFMCFGDPRQPGPNPDLQKVKNPVEATEASLKQGEALYRRYCLTCHGLDGTGHTDMADLLDVPPADFTDKEWKYGASDGEIFSVIREGVETGMEPFKVKINEQRTWHLVNFIRTFSKKDDEGRVQAQAAAVPENPIPYSGESVARGKQFYARFCVKCHGRDGHGDTEMREFLSTHPSDLTDATWKYGARDGDIFLVIKNGTEYDMESFGDRLSDERIWHVVNYLRSLGPKSAQE